MALVGGSSDRILPTVAPTSKAGVAVDGSFSENRLKGKLMAVWVSNMLPIYHPNESAKNTETDIPNEGLWTTGVLSKL